MKELNRTFDGLIEINPEQTVTIKIEGDLTIINGEQLQNAISLYMATKAEMEEDNK